MNTLRIIIIAPIIIIFAGCSAYREISTGSIQKSAQWHAFPGDHQSYRGEVTVLQMQGQITIEALPCNYGDKYFFSIAPPLPLGKSAGIKKSEVFLVGLTLFPVTRGYTFNPSQIIVSNKTGKRLPPSKISIGESVCSLETESMSGFTSINGKKYRVRYSDQVARTWEAPPMKPIELEDARLELTLMFYGSAPSLDEEFSLSLNGLSKEGTPILVPAINFSKGAHWGGW